MDALEEWVRHTTDRLTELVETRLPQAVDGVRADLDGLRAEMRASLEKAAEELATERRELRAQIAKTVGAANRWFVKARDQLIERIDQLAEVTADVERAKVALPVAPSRSPGGSDSDLGLEWDVDEEAVTREAGGRTVAAARPEPQDAPTHGPEAGPGAETRAAEPEGGVVWAKPPGAKPGGVAVAAPQAASGALGADEVVATIEAVRGDIQDLQLEVSAVGHAVARLQAELDKVAKRLPAKPRPVRLDERDLDLIVESVVLALSARSPLTPGPARKSPGRKAPAARTAPRRGADLGP
ncbi:MAG: hypothetical protein AB1673_15710 [Actinomycetota bacterium]